MCTTELWTYAECGCHFEHLIPCHPDFNVTKSSTPSQRSQQKAQYATIVTPATAELRPTQSHQDPRPLMYRECSIRHTVNKMFLEPICDECILIETGNTNSLIPGMPYKVGTDDDTALIWESDVKIEIDDETGPQDAYILESNVEILIQEAADDSLPTRTPTPIRRLPIVSTRRDSNNDADDEKSLRNMRGRPRNNTKTLRRRAMDICRDSLRISSRTVGQERQTLEAFRSTLTNPSPETLLPKLVNNSKITSGWAQNLFGNLTRSLSRNSTKPYSKDDEHDDGVNSVMEDPAVTSTSNQTVRILKAVVDERHDGDNLAPFIPRRTSSAILKKSSTINSRSRTDQANGWDKHLEEDLSRIKRNEQHSSIHHANDRERAKPLVHPPQESATKTDHWMTQARHYICMGSDAGEEESSSVSHPSSTPLIPLGTSSGDSSTSMPRTRERKSSIAGSTGFETNGDSLISIYQEFEPGIEVAAKKSGAAVGEGDHADKSSFIVRPSTSESRALSSQAPEPSKQINKMQLSLHPLRTQLLYNPYDRTSSAESHQSQPSANPDPLLVLPSSAAQSRSTQDHRTSTNDTRSPTAASSTTTTDNASATKSSCNTTGRHPSSSSPDSEAIHSQSNNNYVCIWERTLCGSCNALLPNLERVRSCVCDVVKHDTATQRTKARDFRRNSYISNNILDEAASAHERAHLDDKRGRNSETHKRMDEIGAMCTAEQPIVRYVRAIPFSAYQHTAAGHLKSELWRKSASDTEDHHDDGNKTSHDHDPRYEKEDGDVSQAEEEETGQIGEPISTNNDNKNDSKHSDKNTTYAVCEKCRNVLVVRQVFP